MLLLAVQPLAALVLPHIAPSGVAHGPGIATRLAAVAGFALALPAMAVRRGKPGAAPAQGPLTPPAPQANEAP